MPELLAQREALRSAAAKVQQVSAELGGEQATLDARAAGFLGSGWQGVAANDFAAGMNEWNQGVREVLTALAEVGRMIAATERDFAATDEAGADVMRRESSVVASSVRARLGGGAL